MKHIHTVLLAGILAILAIFPAPLTGCAALQKGASEVTPVLTKISDAAQYLDAAWGAFCLFKPSVCQQYGGEYQRAKGILAASLLAARDTTEAVAGGRRIIAQVAAGQVVRIGGLRDVLCSDWPEPAGTGQHGRSKHECCGEYTHLSLPRNQCGF